MYYEPDGNKVSVADIAPEDNCIYRMLSKDKFCYGCRSIKMGGYFLQKTSAMFSFSKVDENIFYLTFQDRATVITIQFKGIKNNFIEL